MKVLKKHKNEIVFIPKKGKEHDGELIFRDHNGEIKFKTPVKNFDPLVVGFKRYCCTGSGVCREELGWCHSDEVITIKSHYY